MSIKKVNSVFMDDPLIYFVSSAVELQSAIDNITVEGIIQLPRGTITLTTAIDLDSGGNITIQGYGDESLIDTGGNWKTFVITSVGSVVLQNFKIDATDATTVTNYTIDINESSDNPVLIDNISFISTFNGYCVWIESDNVSVCNSRFVGTKSGIWYEGASNGYVYNNYFYLQVSFGIGVACYNGTSHLIISNNTFTGSTEYDSYTPVSGGVGCSYITIVGNIIHNTGNGFWFWTDPISHITIVGNTIEDFDAVAILLDGDYCTISGNVICNGNRNSGSVCAGIRIGEGNTGNYNNISGNIIYNIQNGGGGAGYGIRIDGGSNENTIVGNTVQNCKTSNISNGGINTYIASNNIA